MANVCGECQHRQNWDLSGMVDTKYLPCEEGHGLRAADEDACSDFIDRRCPGVEPRLGPPINPPLAGEK